MSTPFPASDEFEGLIFDSHGNAPGSQDAPTLAVSKAGVVEYNEASYLATYPDAQEAIEAGEFDTPFAHYDRVGRVEHRLASAAYLETLAGGREQPSHGEMSFTLDAVLASSDGTVFIVGWSNDRTNPLLSISIVQGDEGWNTRGIARCRRHDVEGVLQVPLGPLYGFWVVHKLGRFDATKGIVMLRARFTDGRFTQTELTPKVVTGFELRETILGHFASLQYLGNRDIESYQQLETGAGAALVTLNRAISASISASAHVERYGPAKQHFACSLVVCLFGKAEYFFLQNTLFASGIGVADVEFVYVSNSPELTETLQKEARISEKVYGLSITLVTLTGNAGFSAANNVAAKFARSDRIVFINPDVFPQDNAWAATHADIIQSKPKEQTLLFGAPLYYDDGSLMHGGMYFDIDQGLSVKPDGIQTSGLIRVEHYGKGAPAWSDRYTAVRPVPAVTGAFISIDRDWFELLDGFTEDYLFGHYEDADLCLKSLQRGAPAWLQDVRFWHLEGKGSVRRPPHEGGSLVNRWVFTRKWGNLIQESVIGRTPSHPLLSDVPYQSFDQVPDRHTVPPPSNTEPPIPSDIPSAPTKVRRSARARG